MTVEALYQELLSAVGFAGSRAVLRVAATYQPAGGVGSRVFPPTYPLQNGRPPYVRLWEARNPMGEAHQNDCSVPLEHSGEPGDHDGGEQPPGESEPERRPRRPR